MVCFLANRNSIGQGVVTKEFFRYHFVYDRLLYVNSSFYVHALRYLRPVCDFLGKECVLTRSLS